MFIVVLILYAVGGEGIHGFAFALVVGVIAGSYSTIYIATPIVLWMNRRRGSVEVPAGDCRTDTATANFARVAKDGTGRRQAVAQRVPVGNRATGKLYVIAIRGIFAASAAAADR